MSRIVNARFHHVIPLALLFGALAFALTFACSLASPQTARALLADIIPPTDTLVLTMTDTNTGERVGFEYAKAGDPCPQIEVTPTMSFGDFGDYATVSASGGKWQGRRPMGNWGNTAPTSFTAGSEYQYSVVLSSNKYRLNDPKLKVMVNGQEWETSGAAHTGGMYILTITSPVCVALDPNQNCGEGVYWLWYDQVSSTPIKNMLYITGYGSMDNYSAANPAPWASYASKAQIVIIGNRVFSVGSNAFIGFSKLKTLILPEGCEAVGELAFANCTSLGSVSLPESVCSVGTAAFYGCTALADFEFTEGQHGIPANCFEGCTSLANVVFPDNMISIGDRAFAGCTSLSALELPASIVAFGDSCTLPAEFKSNVFSGCSGLSLKSQTGSHVQKYASKFGIPFTSIGTVSGPCGTCGPAARWVFDASTGTVTVTGAGDMRAYPWGHWGPTSLWVPIVGAVKRVVIGSGITGVGEEAFSCLDNLASISFANTVTHIDYGAFAESGKLASVSIPASVKQIGDWAFYSCPALKSVELRKGLVEIGHAAFESCDALASIAIPEGVVKVGEDAFEYCKSLKSVKLPSTLVDIEEYLFYECESLESIEIPQGIEYIGRSAFYGCKSLQEIALPSTLTDIESWAFSRCASLDHLVIPEKVEYMGAGMVAKCSNLKYVQVLPQNLSSYTEKELFRDYDDNAHTFIPLTGLEIYAFDGAPAKALLESYGYTVKSLRELKSATVADIPAQTYTGKAIEPALTVTVGGAPVALGKDYKVSYANNINAGTAQVKIVGVSGWIGELSKTFTILKAKNPMTAKAKSVKVKWKKVKKKTQKLAAKKLITVKGAQGKVTYKLGKISSKKKLYKQAKKKLKLSGAGKLTAKKGLKKGTYKFKVKVKAAGNGNYESASKTVTVKLKVK